MGVVLEIEVSKRHKGFTLLELVLASSLSAIASIALMSWFVSFYSALQSNHDEFVKVQHTHYWVHWLWRDMAREISFKESVHVDSEGMCLTYGAYGVRIRNRQLQWRPTLAACDSNGWQALHDPSQVQFEDIEWTGDALCLTSRSVSGAPRLHKECVTWLN